MLLAVLLLLQVGLPAVAFASFDDPATLARAAVPGVASEAVSQIPASCATPSTRPPIKVVTRALGGGRVEATILSGTGSLTLVKFGAMRNAHVEVPGSATSYASNSEIKLPPNVATWTFIVVGNPAPQADQAATVPFTVFDGCGSDHPWSSFVGGGPAALQSTLSIADVRVAEGNSGTTDATFAVKMSAPSALPVTVAYATADGTATAGQDYVAAAGTLTFAAGETSKSIVVQVKGDTTPEPDETFTVTLSSPVNAVLGDGSATGTIVNDDAAPTAGDDTYVAIVGQTLTVGAGSGPPPGLLVNDPAGSQSLAIASFGGLNAGGSVTTNAAGTTDSLGNGGSLKVNADGSFTFTPPSTFTGPFSFRYRATSAAGSTEATVTIDVRKAPDAVDDPQYSATGSVQLQVPAGTGLLANDTRGAPEGLVASFGGGSVGGTVTGTVAGQTKDLGNGGSLQVDPDGAFAFTAPSTVTGPFTFQYRLKNAAGSDDATVTVDVRRGPAIGTSPGPTGFLENGAPVVVDALATVDSPGHADLTLLTATIGGLADTGWETLAATTAGTSIVASYTAPTLTLAGNDTEAHYQQVLRSVTYVDTNPTPTPGNRTIQLTGTSSGQLGNTATKTVAVSTVNDAPSGADKTITLLEDATYVFAAADFGFTDPNDSPANALLGVKLTTLPAAGVLANNGTPVTVAGTTIPAADIAGGKLTFTPAPNGNGSPYATFTFQVQDNGGTLGGGIDLDPSPNTITLNVTAVSDPPTGTSNAVTTLEDTAYTFKVADFGFSDPSNAPAPHTLAAVKITTLPVSGTLLDDGTPVTAGQLVPVADITASKLTFVPAANGNGAPYTSFTFQVQDTGSTANGGTNLDPTPRTMTINVTPVNDNPVANNDSFTVLEDSANNSLDILANDQNPDSGETLTIVGITAVGVAQGVPSLGPGNTSISYTPNTNGCNTPPGTALDTYTYDISDGNGGAATGTFTVAITCVNDAPSGADKTVTTNEDTPYTFGVADFGFSDPNDTPKNAFLAVTIASLPLAGSLLYNGSPFTAPTSIPAGDITAGKLTFAPALNANGAAYASFIFQVQDDGGTALGGADTDPSPKTMTINVTSVDDAPVVTTSGGTTAFTEGTAVLIDAGVTVSDVDDANIESATVQITTNCTPGEDLLVFVTQNGISGVYTAATCTLALTGSSSVANYQTALASVKYDNSSNAPTAATRTVTFRVNDGDVQSAVLNATKDVSITTVNSAPVVTTSGGITAYTEGTPIAIDSGVTVTDPDDTNLESATVQITTNCTPGEDLLVFSTQNGISGVYTAATCTLALTGSATKASYQTALRSVQYDNSSNAPSILQRTVTFTVNDGDITSTTTSLTKNVSVAASNDAPVVTTSAGTTAFVERTAIVIDAGVTVTDPDDTNIESATVQITTNCTSGQDLLVFVTQNGITGVYTAASCTLALTGSSSVANYQTALASVQYDNSSNAPSTATRTVTFTVNDGDVNSAALNATRDVSVTGVNSAPVVTTSGGITAYVEGTPIAIDASLTVTDPDDTNLESAQISLFGNCNSSQDVLLFTNQNGITSPGFDSVTCVLTLTGTSSVANYETALRSIKYDNSSNAPSTATRTVGFQVNDGDVFNTNANRTKDVSVTAVNDAPVVTASAGATAFTEDGGAVTIDGGVTVSDPDDANIESATVEITTNCASGEDLLLFVTQAGISGSTAGHPCRLDLTGSATKAAYQTALASVQYNNLSQNPSALARTVTFRVNDGDVNSGVAGATKSVSVTSVNDAPVLGGVSGSFTYTENDPATVIAAGITVTDVDSAILTQATISLGATFQSGQDVLSITLNAGTMGNIAVLSNTGGVLTLQSSPATATLAQWQAALAAVKYNNSSENPSAVTRTVTFQVNDGAAANNLSNVVSRDITVVPVNDPPVAADFTFNGVKSAVRNTDLVVDDASDGAPDPAGPQKTVSGDLLGGATDVDTPAASLAVVVPGSPITTNDGGSVVIQADGDFTYTPKVGTTATTDFFDYTVTDQDPTDPKTDVGRVTIALQATPTRIWYVDDSAPAGGNGTSEHPFNSLAPLNGAGGAGDVDSPNDIIFLYSGTYTGGLILEDGQQLIGQSNGLVVPDGGGAAGTVTLEAATGSANNPVINGTVTLATGNTIQGINFGATSGFALSGTSVGTATIDTVTNGTINNTLGGAVSITTGGTLNMTLASTTSTAGANGISLTGLAGTINFGTTSISGSTGTGVNLSTDTTAITFGSLAITAPSGAGLVANNAGTVNIGGTTNTVSATGGPALNLTSTSLGTGATFSTVSSSGSPTTGIALTGVTGPLTMNGGSIGTAAGADFLVSGGIHAITYAGTITNTAGRSVDIQGRGAGAGSGPVTLSGTISDTGTGIFLDNNDASGAATIAFTGQITASTGGSPAFTATNGGIVTSTNAASTLTTTTGTALNVANTTIGAGGLKFTRIDAGTNASGPANGIVLNNTGNSGSLTVSGTGSASSGGTIQHTTSHGISLTSTLSPSFTNMNIHDIARNGVDGIGVTNVTFVNSTINKTATAAAGQFEENSMAFVDRTAPNPTGNTLSGNVTITGNTITEPHRNGIMIETWNGTISNLNISNNTMSGGTTTNAIQDAIHVFPQGSASTTANLTTGTIQNNTISGFRFFDSLTSKYIGGNGIRVAGGSGNGTNTTSATLGTLANPITISGNDVDDVGSNGIAVSFNGEQGTSNFIVRDNGTLADPMSNMEGLGISVFFGGNGNFTALVHNNFIDNNGATVRAGSAGIGIQMDTGPSGSTSANPQVKFTVTNNRVDHPDGSGLIAIGLNNAGLMNLRMNNNTVATAPFLSRAGIRVSENSAGPVICTELIGNTSHGSGINAGMAVRKNDPTAFGIVGLTPSPTNAPDVYINSQNPAGGGTDVVNGTGYTSCTLPTGMPVPGP